MRGNRWGARAASVGGLALALALAGCTLAPPVPVEDRRPTAVPAAPQVLERARARWLPADWADLPAWQADRARELWPALAAGCARPAEGWASACRELLAAAPADDEAARQALQRLLQPYRVESLDGQVTGLATGYYEPLLPASRQPRAGFATPLWRLPPELAQRQPPPQPYWTRQQLDTVPAAKAAVRGQEIAWLASPLDALVLHIQGSGRLRVTEPDGRERSIRVAYAGHNGHPYRSVGRWLIEQGALKADEASWPAIRAWALRAPPERLNAMLWSNPRVVFFREEPLDDDNLGPKGAQGVPLTPQRSVAVDPQAVPYGTPLWLDTTEPLAATPLRRLVMAQDTGSAIQGAVRVDYFWGWGPQAEAQAGRMKQPLKLWALWPR